jgi:DNA-binding NarL/FixJ family response regulator
VGEDSDGLQAVQKAEQLQPNLILLDIGLPTLNGIEAARRISQLVPSGKVLFVNHSHDAAIVAAALSNGASGYVYKGDLRTELLPAVEAVLCGDRFLSRGLQTAELPQTKPQFIRSRL